MTASDFWVDLQELLESKPTHSLDNVGSVKNYSGTYWIKVLSP